MPTYSGFIKIKYILFGKKIILKKFDNGKVNKYIYSFNLKKQIRKLKKYESGDLIEKQKYCYMKNNKVEVYYYSKEDGFYAKIINKYDENNIITEGYLYDSFGNLNEKEISRLNKDGHELLDCYQTQTKNIISIYEYDNSGNIILESEGESSLEGAIQTPGERHNKYRYDTYDYDKEGNWHKMIFYINNKLTQITEREIDYY